MSKKAPLRCESCGSRRQASDVLEYWCVHLGVASPDCQRRRFVCRPTDAQASLCFRQKVGDRWTHAIGEVRA